MFKSFVLILFSLSLIAWTVRAVNFLDLIVDSGYSTSTYFIYSLLNLTNIMTKFIPLSFLLALLLTIVKLERQNELLILWTSGIAKFKITNLFISISLIVFIYLIFSTIITPTALNKSRGLIKQSGVDTISNLVKTKYFSDTFKGLTFYSLGEKNNNEVKNIFIKDDANNLE